MAETLSELVVKIKADASQLEKGLSDAEGKTEASSKKMADSLKKVGVAMAASGAAITAALGLMGKAAIDEDINIKRLAGTLSTVGVSYDTVKDSLEAVISATQRKTGVADSEQRDILNRLILITRDYEKSLELLPTVLDLAADSGMDATTAATYLSKAYLELEEGAEEVSIVFGRASIKFKDLADIQDRVKGKAEALANPLSVLKTSMGDVAEAIGANLLPLIKDAVDKIVDITVKVRDWIKEHPLLARVLTLAALALGVILTVVGGLILAMPVITALVAAFGVVFHAALGPIGLVSLAIAGIIVVIGLVIANWDNLTNIFRSDAEKQKRALESLTEKVNTEFDKQAAIIKSVYKKQRGEAEKTYKAAVDAIDKEYGVAESTTKNKIELAKEEYQADKEKYRKEIDAAQARYQSEMQLINDTYDLKISTLQKETVTAVNALQDQIDAIDAQTDAEELIITRAEEQKRLAELQGAYVSAKTAKEKAETKVRYDEYVTQVARNELLRVRDAEKDALRKSIETARDASQTEEERLRALQKTELATLKQTFDTKISTMQAEADALDAALVLKLAGIETNRLAAITAQQAILTETLADIKTAETAEVAALAEQLAASKRQVQDINEAYNALIKRYDIEIVTHERTVRSDSGRESGGRPPALGEATTAHPFIGGFAAGGVVPGVMGQPFLATVHGGETIIPPNESMGSVVVNFTQPVFVDREDTMNKFVDMIRKGIQRQDRLRFGGAFNG